MIPKTSGQYDVLEYMEANKPNKFTTRELSEIFNANNNSIARKLKKLWKSHLIRRKTIHLNGSGHLTYQFWAEGNHTKN